MVGAAPGGGCRSRQAAAEAVTRRIAFQPAARRDIDDIAEHIAQDSVDAALRFLEAVESTVRGVIDDPGIGRQREFVHREVRGLRSIAVDGFRRHMLFYHHDARFLTVVRVLHGARDLERAFEEE